MKNIFFFAISDKTWNERCAILAEPKQCCRLQILDFSSPETDSRYFFPLSKEEVRNGEVFVEHSQFRVRGKSMETEHSQSITSLSWPKHVLSALYLREKVRI